jgi:hypothetical protein
MKVYTLPDEVPAPRVDYMKYDSAKVAADEAAHREALKKHFTDLGYKGKNTGRIYREQVADGYAEYMAIEAPRGTNAKVKFFLIHLPYGDAYQSRTVGHMSKSGILQLIDADERMQALFSKK